MIPSLFDVEDANLDGVKVRDTHVAPVTQADVEEFTRRYHYTGQPGMASWRWGLWHGFTLFGIVSYNLPSRFVCDAIFGAEHGDHVWHMGRLSMAEHAPRNSESRLIAGSLKAIENGHPHVWAVVTYAATDLGHIGYVYQATNATYTGISHGEVFYLDATGRRFSPRNATRNGQSGYRITADEAAEKGWERFKGGDKHRYVYVLGNRTERKARLALLRLPVLPYPKAVAA